MALRAGISPLKRIVSNVEVERKFNPCPNFASLLSEQAAGRPLSNRHGGGALAVLRQPGQLIRDTYYDTGDGQLSDRGLWVRQRYYGSAPAASLSHARVDGAGDGGDRAEWNAKLRVGGHFTNSQFVELDGKEAVAREVLRVCGAGARLEDLRAVADLQTRRAAWAVVRLPDGTPPAAQMTVVVDAVTEAGAGAAGGSDDAAFRHTVGEVELFQTVATEGEDAAEHEARRKEAAARRMGELEALMRAGADLFPTSPPPVGKLAAYYAWKAAASRP